MKRMPKQRAGTYHDALMTLKSEFRTKFITSYPLTTEMCLCLALDLQSSALNIWLNYTTAQLLGSRLQAPQCGQSHNLDRIMLGDPMT